MILLVPKSSHSPLAGAAAPANVSRSLPAAPVREPKIWGKRKPWTSVFFFPLFFPVIFPWGTRSALLRGFPQKFFRYFRMVLLPKKGGILYHIPQIWQTRQVKKSYLFLFGEPLWASANKGFPFLFLQGKRLYIKWGGWFFLPFSGRR